MAAFASRLFLRLFGRRFGFGGPCAFRGLFALGGFRRLGSLFSPFRRLAFHGLFHSADGGSGRRGWSPLVGRWAAQSEQTEAQEHQTHCSNPHLVTFPLSG